MALEAGIRDGVFIREDILAERLTSPIEDVPFEPAVEAEARRAAVALNASDYRAVTAERSLETALQQNRDNVTVITALEANIGRLTDEIGRMRSELDAAREREQGLASELEAMHRRRVVRVADAIQRSLPGRSRG